MGHKRPMGLVLLLLLMVLISVPVWLTYRQMRQDRLNHALIAAIQRHDVPAALAALNAGADPNSRDEGRQSLSFWRSLRYLFTRLWRYDKLASPKPGSTALMLALENASADYYAQPTVRVLIARGANVNVADEEGDTPLMLAAKSEPADIVQALLDKGAEVNARDNAGDTALLLAAKADTVKVLLRRGAEVNSRNKTGYTALMAAAFCGSTDMTRVLLTGGADVNSKDTNGQTALSIAEENGLHSGADVNSNDFDGTTASSYTKTDGYSAVVHLLKQAGAKE